MPRLGDWAKEIQYRDGGVLPATGVVEDAPLSNGTFRSTWGLDVNGDGLTDILSSPIAGSGGAQARILISTGNGFLDVGATPAVFSTYLTIPQWDGGMRPMDCNGDGRTDMAFLRNTNAICHVFQSETTMSSVPWPLRTATAAIPGRVTDPEEQGLDQLIDVNGDGQDDLVSSHADGLHVYVRKGGKPDLMTGVVDGATNTTTVKYVPLIGARYTNPENFLTCHYPQVCVKKGHWVVDEYGVETGRIVGGQHQLRTHRLWYQDGRADLAGRGFLGFRVITDSEMNEDKSAVLSSVIREYEVDAEPGVPAYPKAGLLRNERRTAQGTTRVIEKTITNVIVTGSVALGYWGVRPTAIVEKETFDGAVTRNVETTMAYDTTYGYLKSRCKRALTEDLTESWSNTFYADDPAAWLVGRAQTLTHGWGGTCATPALARTTSYVWRTGTHVLASETIEPGRGQPYEKTTEYVRGPTGALEGVIETDVEGRRIASYSTYDGDGVYPTSTINEVGHVTQTTYHPGLGVLVATTDPNGVTSRAKFDTFGRLKERRRYDVNGQQDGNETSVSYTRPAEPTVSVDVTTTKGTGQTNLERFDSLGRPTVVRTALSTSGMTQFVNTYDYRGNLESVTAPHFVGSSPPIDTTSYGYDNFHRPLSITQRGASTPTVQYVHQGRKTFLFTVIGEVTDASPRRAIRYIENDDLGRVSAVGDFTDDGRILTTTYHYREFSQVDYVRVNDDPSNQTTYHYDLLGRSTGNTTPDSRHTSATYDAFGRMTTATNAAGERTSFERDALGRIHSTFSPDGVSRERWDSAPNGIGASAGDVSFDGVVTEMTYDTFGRPTRQKIVAGGESFEALMSYDNHNRIQYTTYPETPGYERLVVESLYDGVGALQQLRRVDTLQDIWSIEDATDSSEPDGRTRIERLGASIVSTRTHDALTGYLTGVKSDVFDENGISTVLQNDSYAYYANGNLKSRSTGADQEIFTYDRLDRLTGWDGGTTRGWDVSYQYDDEGNLQRRIREDRHADDVTFTYGANGAGRHALTGSPWGTYTYDAAGRQTTGEGRTINSYTAFNLPRSVTTAQGTIGFLYNASGQRTMKLSQSKDTFYFGNLYERTRDNATGALHHTLFVSNDERVVAQIERSDGPETTTFRQDDNLGTPNVTMTPQGAVSRVFTDPFGNVTSPNDPVVSPVTQTPSRRGLGGHEIDDDLGLLNFGGRLYDPRVGRFITPDPVVSNPLSGQTFNPYSFVRNNPVTLADPSGYVDTVPGTMPSASGGGTIDGGTLRPICVTWDRKLQKQSVHDCPCKTSAGGSGSGGDGGGEASTGQATDGETPGGGHGGGLKGGGSGAPKADSGPAGGGSGAGGRGGGDGTGAEQGEPGAPGSVGTLYGGYNDALGKLHGTIEGPSTLPSAVADYLNSLVENGGKALKKAGKVVANGRTLSSKAFANTGSWDRFMVIRALQHHQAMLKAATVLGGALKAYSFFLTIAEVASSGASNRSIIKGLVSIGVALLVFTPVGAGVAAGIGLGLAIFDATGGWDATFDTFGISGEANLGSAAAARRAAEARGSGGGAPGP
jgi:RHS repeat-associated protein